MHSILKLSALTIVLAAAGCGTAPASLSVPKSLTQLELRDNFVYTAGPGNGSVKTETTLSAGLYTASYADGAGVYHKGPAQCYKVKVLEKGWVYAAEKVGQYAASADCGIYIFNDSAIAPKIYQVLGTDTGFFAPTASRQPTSNAVGESIVRNQPHLAGASPMATGVGVPLAMGIGDALSEMERGKLQIFELPFDREALRKALVSKPPLAR